MNTNLTLRKTDAFNDIRTSIYENDDHEFCMTSRQLGECLGYAVPLRSVNNLINRYSYLKTEEFSSVTKLMTVDGKYRKVRVFNEDGIYEVAFLSNTDKAFEFRQWVRKLLKALRKGDLQLAKDNVTFSHAIFEAQLNQRLGLLQDNLLAAKPTPPNYWLWKKHTANPFISSLSEKLQIDTRTAYDLVYDRMFADYGFDRSFAMSQYCVKYGVENVAVIDAIADSPTYQQWFVFSVRKICTEVR